MTKALHTIGKLQTRDEVGRAHAMEAASRRVAAQQSGAVMN